MKATRSSSVNSGCLDKFGRDGNDDAIDELQAALDQVFVSAGDRIEAAGIHGRSHRESGMGNREIETGRDQERATWESVRKNVIAVEP